jgi:uncharacterized membrane protein
VNMEETKPAPSVARSIRPVWGQLFKTIEGRILLLGISLALAGLVASALVVYWSPRTSRMIFSMIFANVIFGRAVSMYIGYAGGYGHAIVVSVNMWVETVLVMLFYPLFVFSMRKLVEFQRLKGFLDRMHAAAENHHDAVRRYGATGLFFFVWLPFSMTGPVVGSAIGYLLGLPAWLTITVVLTGTYTAMAAWAYLLFELYTRTAVFGPWAPVLIVVLIVVIVFATYLLNQRVKNRKHH